MLHRATLQLRLVFALLSKGALRPSSEEEPLIADRWEVRRRIGKGAFAEVLEVRDVCSPGKTFALKVYPGQYHLLAVREATILQHLARYESTDHQRSYFLRCYDGFCSQDLFYLRLELMSVNLYQFISCTNSSSTAPTLLRPIVRRKEDVSQKEAFPYLKSHLETLKLQSIALSLLTGLAFMHHEGVIHADIKPENIYLQFEKEISVDPKQLHKLKELPGILSVKIADFSNSFHTSELKFGQSIDYEVQSLPYRAPEVLFGCPFGVQIDVWSVGVLLLELCLHRVLFQVEDRGGLVAQIGKYLGYPPLRRFAGGKFYNGLLSFYPELHRESSFQETCQGVEALLLELYVELPRHLVSFLATLLSFNPDERSSALAALQHPFLGPVMGLPLRSILRVAGSTLRSQADAAAAGSLSELRDAKIPEATGVLERSPGMKVCQQPSLYTMPPYITSYRGSESRCNRRRTASAPTQLFCAARWTASGRLMVSRSRMTSRRDCGMHEL